MVKPASDIEVTFVEPSGRGVIGHGTVTDLTITQDAVEVGIDGFVQYMPGLRSWTVTTSTVWTTVGKLLDSRSPIYLVMSPGRTGRALPVNVDEWAKVTWQGIGWL